MADFVTKKENFRRLWIIILCAVAMAVSIAFGIYALREANHYAEDPENPFTIKQLAPQIDQLRQQIRDVEDQYYSFAQPIGWFHPGLTTVDRFGRTALDVRNMQGFLSDLVQLPADQRQDGRKALFEQIGITGYKRWDDPGAGTPLTLKSLFEELAKKEKEAKTRIEELKGQIESEIKKGDDIRKKMEEDNKTALSPITGGVDSTQAAQGHIAELIRLEKEFNQLQRSHAEELAQLEVDTRAKQNEATQVKNENLRKKAAAESVKADFQRRIFAIQYHREEARERREPDGAILAIDEARQIAWVDLLRKDRLFKGTKFRVYSLEKGGQKLDKGEIEAVQVREENSSICAILRVYSEEWPLKVGDRIYNELYEGGRTRHIAFAGRFTGRLSNQEAAALIRGFGDIYQPEVDEKTNYVVVADGYEDDPNYKAALEYGIKILREPILYDYLGVPR